MAFECETEKWQNLFWVIYWGHSKNEGGFPIETKTKITYDIICCYHNFIR